jgi:serine/threonine kinase PknH
VEGTTFGPYTIESLLGRGGMGEVYRAFDTETDREVALKVLPAHLADDPEYTERFRRECRAAAKLRDPHVVPIHRFGEIDGRLYLDMRLVSGNDLGSRLAERGPLAPAVAVSVVGQIASALDAAHAEGMIHRDVKPSNILLTGPDDELFAYLFDFGIASSSGMSDGGEQLTRSGTVPGSVAYLAPERFHGVPADRRVDVYALACVLYQSLTGRAPFAGDLPTLMHAHLHQPAPLIHRADVPAGLDDVVARGMAKDPNHRYATAGELAAAARTAVGTGPVPTAPPTATDTPRPSTFGTVPSDPRYAISQPSHPQYPQYPQVGGWSSAPQTALGWQTGPPPAPKRKGISKAGLTAVILTCVVLLVGLGVTGYFVNRVITTATSATTTPTPTPTPQAVTTAVPGSEDPQLLASLPGGFSSTNCAPNLQTATNIGGTSYFVCENGPADGPDGATFSRYAQQSLLDAGFDGAATAENVPLQQDAQHAECRNGAKIATGYSVDGRFAGRVGCYLDPSGAAYLFWSDNAALSFGYLRRTDGNAGLLYDWWLANDFRR